jgi:hypothetical protein
MRLHGGAAFRSLRLLRKAKRRGKPPLFHRFSRCGPLIGTSIAFVIGSQ